MLNYLWGFMMLVGILWAAVHGNLGLVTAGALESAGEAVKLCITMLGVMSFWTGILEVGRRAGLIEQLSAKMRPLLRFLFPHIPENHPSLEAIATNMIANVIGVGWAATPAGLKAMEELAKLEEERGTPGYVQPDSRKERAMDRISGKGSDILVTGKGRAKERVASNEMCTFLILNISSFQLIPVNMIAYRSQYGSANPAGIIAPAIVATFVSTAVAVVYCKIMDKKQ